MIKKLRIIEGSAESRPVNQIGVEVPRARRQQESPQAVGSPEVDTLLKSMFRCVGLIVAGWGFVLISVSILYILDTSGDCSTNASVSEVQVRTSQTAIDRSSG